MCIPLLPFITNTRMLGGKIVLSSAAALLSATGASALVPVLDKRQYFPANATDLKTITVCAKQHVSLMVTDLDDARGIAFLSEDERESLSSPVGQI